MSGHEPEDMGVYDRAARWVGLMRRRESRRAQFFQWITESPRHVEETLLAITIAQRVSEVSAEQWDEIEAAAGTDGTAADVTSNVVPLTSATTSARRGGSASRGLRWTAWAGLLAASVTCVAVALWWFAGIGGWEVYATGIGEQRAVVLDDGSLMQLNTATRAEVRFAEHSREVRLLSGEAMFTVAHNRDRPFRVHAGTSTIQAVGTQFNVYRPSEGETRVAVVEGRVLVTPAQTPPSPLGPSDATQPADATQAAQKHERTGGSAGVYLSAGEQATVAASGQMSQAEVDVARAGAWRERRLVFREDPLSAIVGEFNRYARTTHLRIEGDGLAARRHTGTFNVDDPESFLAMLAMQNDVIIEREGQDVVIRQRPVMEQPK